MPKKTMINILFGVLLAGVLITFVNLGISVFYPEPEVCDFPRKACIPRIDNQTEGCPVEENFEDNFEECREARNIRNQNIFYILGVIGLIAITIGLSVPNLVANWSGLLSGFWLIIQGMIINSKATVLNFITAGVLIIIIVIMIIVFQKRFD